MSIPPHLSATTPDSIQRAREQIIQRDSTLNFPLNVRMRILTLAPQFYIERPHGRQVAYIKQKLFAFTEKIEIYKDANQNRLLYRINADRMIDFSAQYHFYSVRDGLIGRTKQQGLASIFRTQFDVLDDTGTRFFIKHQNPLVEIIEALLMFIPYLNIFLGLLSGYILNPKYIVTNLAGDEVATLDRRPSFFEGKYEMRKLAPLTKEDEELIILSMLTLILMKGDDDDGDDYIDD